MNIPKYIILHHEAPNVIVNNLRFDIVNNYHKQQGYPKSSLGYYCGYHYFIEKTGQVIQARLDTDEGAHTRGLNLTSIGICMAGNFDLEYPTNAQINTLKKLLKEKVAQYGIPYKKVLPHRNFANKSCYGSNLPDEWIQNLLKIDLLQLLVELYKQLMQKIKYG